MLKTQNESSLSQQRGTSLPLEALQELVPGFISAVPVDIAAIGQFSLGSDFVFCAGRAFVYGLEPQLWLSSDCSAHDLANDWPLACGADGWTQRNIQVVFILGTSTPQVWSMEAVAL